LSDLYAAILGRGELVLVAVAERDAQLGMVRVEALRAAASLT
jgi:predicted regulator of Ras-like GTPase activity (Roadblock/LC7/MglB family)